MSVVLLEERFVREVREQIGDEVTQELVVGLITTGVRRGRSAEEMFDGTADYPGVFDVLDQAILARQASPEIVSDLSATVRELVYEASEERERVKLRERKRQLRQPEWHVGKLRKSLRLHLSRTKAKTLRGQAKDFIDFVPDEWKEEAFIAAVSDCLNEAKRHQNPATAACQALDALLHNARMGSAERSVLLVAKRLIASSFTGITEQERESLSKHVGELRHVETQPDLALRTKVIARDKGMCSNCGGTADLAVVPIESWEDGGFMRADNLRTLCGICRNSE